VGIGTDDPQTRLQVADGDIFIQDINKGIIMKSPNGQCWRGTMNDQGMLVFVPVNCPGGSASSVNQSCTDAQVRIYPNPTSGSVTIELPEGIANASWMLNTLEGVTLASGKLSSDQTEISLAHFVTGIYMLTIEHKGHIIKSEKIIK